MRTILYCLTIGGTFIYGMIFRYPFTFFMNEEQKKRYVEKIAVRWARNCMWAAGSKVELVYKNKASIDEIKKLETLQEKLQEKMPYFIKYDKNYLWQIFFHPYLLRQNGD